MQARASALTQRRLRVWRSVALGVVAALGATTSPARVQAQETNAGVSARIDYVVVLAAPDVPPGVVARVRGELLTAGYDLVASNEATDASIVIKLRQSATALVAELRRHGGREDLLGVVTANLPSQATPTDTVSTYSELAWRTTERLAAYVLAPQVMEAPPPAPKDAPPEAASGAVPSLPPAVVATGVVPGPVAGRWLSGASVGGAFGLMGARARPIARLFLSRRFLRRGSVGLGATLPFPSITAESASAQAEVSQAWGGAEVAAHWSHARGPTLSVAVQAGVGRTFVAGDTDGTARGNTSTIWSGMTTLSVAVGMRLSAHWHVRFDVAGTSLLPRPGVRLSATANETTAWVMPSTSLGAVASW